jgi:hypothetical protein
MFANIYLTYADFAREKLRRISRGGAAFGSEAQARREHAERASKLQNVTVSGMPQVLSEPAVGLGFKSGGGGFDSTKAMPIKRFAYGRPEGRGSWTNGRIIVVW